MSLLRCAIPGAALAALAGCLSLPPEGTTQEDLEAYDAAVVTLGCQLVSEADYGALEFQAGLSREQAIAITEQRLARDEAVRLETGGVRLTSGSCAG